MTHHHEDVSPCTDASDAVEYAEEIVARFRMLQRHEEAHAITLTSYEANLTELRVLLGACMAYAAMPRIAVNSW